MTYLSLSDRLLRCLCKLLDGLLIISKILLTSNKDDGKAIAEMENLGNPLYVCALELKSPTRIVQPYLLLNVLQRVRRVDGKADQDDVRIGVRQGAQAVVIFLSSSIPKRELNMLSVDLDIGDVVLKDGRDVHLVRKIVISWGFRSIAGLRE